MILSPLNRSDINRDIMDEINPLNFGKVIKS